MLTIFGQKQPYCDGISRRSFLKIGAFTFGATSLTLADIFRAEARTGVTGKHLKAVINVLLGGGPPHQDMWDIKTEAPAEIRGEFRPIATNVTGVQIGECFPRLASMWDKCVAVRSITGADDRHELVQCLTGFSHTSLAPLGGRPAVGAVLSRLRGPANPSVPPFVGLCAPTTHRPWSDSGQSGFLGPA